MSAPLSPTTRAALLATLGVGKLPSESEIKEAIEQEFLLPSAGGHKEFSDTEWAMHWTRPPALRTLLHIEPTFPTTTLSFNATGLNGTITSYSETSTSHSTSQPKTALNSTSLDRAPSSYTSSFVRGKSTYFPFRPGGLGVADLAEEDGDEVGVTDRMEKAFEKGSGGIRTIPPGFTRGLDFGPQMGEWEEEEVAEEVVPMYRPMGEVVSDGRTKVGTLHGRKAPARPAPVLDSSIEELLPTRRLEKTTTTTSTRRRPIVAKRDWAHVVDVNREITNFKELVPDMAREYPFELDTFQKEAIYHMEVGESVFVAAHTSAGKTVVAEYAIALAARHMTRAIYTSPIKALSNQKFRDFQHTFPPSSVGILTGDVQINPEASCLIMTTEILRSMLYKGADLIRDVEWVIFDEVHYVNDLEVCAFSSHPFLPYSSAANLLPSHLPQRGVVWEEVIIMLPDHVNIILLSATVPNTKEFADWVGRTKKKDIYVISTPKRPVPLEHFLYSGKELWKIVDAKGQFLSQGYRDAGESIKRKQDKEREAAGILPPTRGGGAPRGGSRGAPPSQSRGGQNRGGGSQARTVAARGMRAARGGSSSGANGRSTQSRDSTLWIHLIGLLKKKELLPVVVFTFSKRRCEEYAGAMPNTDLCTASEKSEVHVAIERSITRLKGSDKTLPQITNMRNLLGRGIGVHHGGLLPIVKEIVELLFARGLVKVLFATETFAMGVNMPAKCVVFSGTRKHDGRSFRDLLPGEYTQMSGRAGRRGLDKTGTVIIVADTEVPDTSSLTHMLLGQPTKLSSQFRLTYSMILNLLRVEALRVEEMIKRSFSENAAQRMLPEHQKKVTEGEVELKALKKLPPGPKTDELHQFYDLSLRIVELNTAVLEGVLSHPAAAKVLATGRLVILSDGHFKDNPAVLLKSAPPAVLPSGVIDSTKQFFVLAFVPPDIRAKKHDVAADAVPPLWPPRPQHSSAEMTYELAIVPITSISLVTSLTMKVDAEAIAERHRRSFMEGALADFIKLMDDGAQLQEADWSKVRGLEFREALEERNELVKKLEFFAVEDEDFAENYKTVHGERVLEEKIAGLRMALSEQNLELLPDYEQRIEVLKDLQFIDDNSTVLLKGRVACEINSANELVLTELILENTFAAYEPEEVVALLSCFIFQEKTDVEPLLTPKLEDVRYSLFNAKPSLIADPLLSCTQGKATILEITERVRRVQSKHRADIAEEGFSTELKFGLVEVVYEWAKGMPFSQVTALTDVQEGTIVRAITRLDETCREVRDAARIVGNADLFTKMEQCQLMIRRDIIFCASLYFSHAQASEDSQPSPVSNAGATQLSSSLKVISKSQSMDSEVTHRVPCGTPATPVEEVVLSPISLWQMGSIPSAHVFPGDLDLERFKAALSTVTSLYPVLGGRLRRRRLAESGGFQYFVSRLVLSPALHLVYELSHQIELSGYPIDVTVATKSQATHPLPNLAVVQPTLAGLVDNLNAATQLNNPEAPLISVRITRFPTIGITVLGLCWAHILGDGDAFSTFTRTLSDLYEGKSGGEVVHPTFNPHVALFTPSASCLAKWEIPQLFPTFELAVGGAMYAKATNDTELVQVTFTATEVKLLKSLASGPKPSDWVSEQDAISSYWINSLRLCGEPISTVVNSINYRHHFPNDPRFPSNLPTLCANVAQMHSDRLPDGGASLAPVALSIRRGLESLKADATETLEWLSSRAYRVQEACDKGEMQCLVPGPTECMVNSNWRYDWNISFGFSSTQTSFHTSFSTLNFLRVFRANRATQSPAPLRILSFITPHHNPTLMSYHSTATRVPGEVVSEIIAAALDALAATPPPSEGPTPTRQLLLSLSLVSKTWSREAQRILFRTESRLTSRKNIKSWCSAAGRFNISSVAVKSPWNLRNDQLSPSEEDLLTLLDAVGSNLRHLTLEISHLTSKCLRHPALRGLRSLRLHLDEDLHLSPLPPVNHPLEFSLDSLDIFINFVDPEDSGPVPAESLKGSLHIIKSLERTVRRARKLRITTWAGHDSKDVDAMGNGVADLIEAAYGSLESLSLGTSHHERINKSLEILQSLRHFTDERRGS
ncbi:antiviral helicase SKI2, partial [Phenoliferia sp. Uapishka_3]